jgi:hypothetical protein
MASVALMCLISPFASTLPSSALPKIASDFHITNPSIVALCLSVSPTLPGSSGTILTIFYLFPFLLPQDFHPWLCFRSVGRKPRLRTLWKSARLPLLFHHILRLQCRCCRLQNDHSIHRVSILCWYRRICCYHRSCGY